MPNLETYDDTVGTISALGRAARELGEPGFHLRLLELVGSLLPHDTAWIVRYSPKQIPDILYTKEISDANVRYYLEAEPAATDPYFCSWCTNAAARIETMEAALPLAVDPKFYSLDFIKRLEFTDELVIFLPSIGASCVSLFFERRLDRFATAELSLIQRIFPTILDFHHAHIRSQLTGMSAVAAGLASIEESVASIFDCAGKCVFSTKKWQQLAVSLEPFRGIANASSCEEIRCQAEASTASLRVIPLDPMNSIAPGGLLLHLMDEGEFIELASDRSASTIFERLTPRERDIVGFAFEGLSTGAIAQRLGITKGSIKNCRMRIYRKFGVVSERELISKLMPISKHLMLRLSGGSMEERSAQNLLLLPASLGISDKKTGD